MNKAYNTFSVIIPAAGVGTRMQSDVPKQYLTIGSKTVLEHTLERFLNHPQIKQIVVAISPSDNIVKTLEIADSEKIDFVLGGAERADSVRNALEFLSQNNQSNEFVLVHDAARPCIGVQELNKLIAVCENNYQRGISGGILAVPVADTIKQQSENEGDLIESPISLIKSTIDRSSLWQAQTPQMFKHLDLLKAIKTSINQGFNVTDEASAMEFAGHKVALVEGDVSNIKITRPSDLKLASFYLNGV